MRRFFVNPSNITPQTAIITDQEAIHLRSVLRLNSGTIIELFDGLGNIYHAKIKDIKKHEVKTQIISSKTVTDNPPFVHLAQACLKGKKMDLIVQKATELGISSVTPFISNHCTVKKISDNNFSRWEKISNESCKQSGRPTPLKINQCLNFSSLIDQSAPIKTKVILWEAEKFQCLSDTFSKNLTDDIIILVGPEGGFSEEEVNLALKNNFHSVSIGNLILRSETAAIAVISIAQYIIGKFNSDKSTTNI